MSPLIPKLRAAATVIGALFGAVMSGSSTVAAAQLAAAQRNLSTHPPHVLTVDARLLTTPVAAGNALIEMTVAHNEVLPARFPVHLEGHTATLGDDGKQGDAKAGDRIYSGYVELDIAAMKRNQQRLFKLQGQLGRLVMPVYRGRQLVDNVPLPDDFFRPLVPGTVVPIDRWGFAGAVVPENSLLVRNTAVVEDLSRTYDACTGAGTPMGKWTFGFLMQQMANEAYTGIDPAEFVRHWIDLSRVRQTINGWSVTPFPVSGEDIHAAWPTLPDGRLCLARAPFKLLAIVNRVDLRENTVYGGSRAGEARFVFGFKPCGIAERAVTVIFEYGIDRSGCIPLKQWAQQWQALGEMTIGSAAFNGALEAITDQFSLAGAASDRTNRSALNRLRTNGGAGPIAWEFREFMLPGLGAGARHLSMTTVAQTPDRRVSTVSYPVADAIGTYVNSNTPQILADDHVVPLTLLGHPFRGGSMLGTPAGGTWNSPAIDVREARHKFALQTCHGCHQPETGTAGFFHVRPPSAHTPPGLAASLSGFMTGIVAADPVDEAPMREFNELERRAVDLDGLANSICVAFTDPTTRTDSGALRGPIPLRMAH